MTPSNMRKDETFTCRHCGKMMKSENELREHERTHDAENEKETAQPTRRGSREQ